MSDSASNAALSAHWREVIRTEEEMAARVQVALGEAKAARRYSGSPLRDYLALREDAFGASEGDLPALIQQMHTLKSQAEVLQPTAFPSLDEPYFAHMTLRTGQKTREVLLGYTTFIWPQQRVTIIDWRHAPVARVFFEYRQGEEYDEEIAGREISGTLVRRWVVAFDRGRLTQIITPAGTVTYRDGWHPEKTSAVPELAGATGGRLSKQIIGTGQAGRRIPVVSALLDKEQHAVIHEEAATPVLVLGGAGCGKTTVALHRVALLSYRDPRRYHPKRMGVVVPEAGLVRLTQVLLEELRMERVDVHTFDEWVVRQARRVFPNLPRKRCHDTPPAVVRFKRHPALAAVLPLYVRKVGKELIARLKKRFFMVEKLEKIFWGARSEHLLGRLKATEKKVLALARDAEWEQAQDAEAIRAVFKEERKRLHRMNEDRFALFGDREILEAAVARSVEMARDAQSKGTHPLAPLSVSQIPVMVRHVRRQFAATDEAVFADVDPERLETLDGRSLDAGTPSEEAGTLDVEDLALLFELHRLKTGKDSSPLGRPKRVNHLVVDEAQDLAPVELKVLGRTMRKEASLTVAGDSAQQIDPWACFRSWSATLADLGRPQYERIELNISYRCTRPIAEFGRKVLGPENEQWSMRSPKPGVPVTVTAFVNTGHWGLFLAQALADLESREEEANVAVIARRQETARHLHSVLHRTVPSRLVLDGGFAFQPGIDVTTVAQVKGLEFDYVIIADGNTAEYPDDAESRRLLYVAVTRAIHQLWIIAVGTLSPIITQAVAESDAEIIA
jgi:DNA helicase-2/ATP-dependent DNA helicase PcrA